MALSVLQHANASYTHLPGVSDHVVQAVVVLGGQGGHGAQVLVPVLSSQPWYGMSSSRVGGRGKGSAWEGEEGGGVMGR
jgi:hypothetical protein